MSNSQMTILLICREGVIQRVYQAELDIPGVLLVCVPDLMEFFSRGIYCPLSGILVDMPTYMRGSEDEKRLLTDLVALFPALRLKCNESTGEIRTLPFGTTYPGNTSPSLFVQKYCTSFAERKVRASERSLLHLPALLQMTLPVDVLPGTKTVTANVSCGGCFLIRFDLWNVGDNGWLVLPTLKDAAPIPVEVCFVRSWGEHGSLPGMGVRFVELSEAQRVELSHLSGQSFIRDEIKAL